MKEARKTEVSFEETMSLSLKKSLFSYAKVRHLRIHSDKYLPHFQRTNAEEKWQEYPNSPETYGYVLWKRCTVGIRKWEYRVLHISSTDSD